MSACMNACPSGRRDGWAVAHTSFPTDNSGYSQREPPSSHPGSRASGQGTNRKGTRSRVPQTSHAEGAPALPKARLSVFRSRPMQHNPKSRVNAPLSRFVVGMHERMPFRSSRGISKPWLVVHIFPSVNLWVGIRNANRLSPLAHVFVLKTSSCGRTPHANSG